MAIMYRKKFLIFSFLFSIFIISTCLFFLLSQKITIAFYDVPEKVQKSYEKIIIEEATKLNKANYLKFITYNSSLSLESQLQPKVDLLFCQSSVSSKFLEKKAKQLPLSLTSGLLSTFRTLVKNNNNIFYPILLDHFEIGYSTESLLQENKEQFVSLQDFFQTVKQQKKTGSPIIVLGGDDSELLQFITAFIESTYGIEGINNLVRNLRNAKTEEEIAKAKILYNITLEDALTQIKALKTNNLLHPQWLSIQFTDFENLIFSGNVEFFFISLSKHRQLSGKSLLPFSTSFMPINSKQSKRFLVCPCYGGIILSQTKLGKYLNAQYLLEKLNDTKNQEKLSQITGLAPINPIAIPRDKQASEVRLWAASANGILNSLDMLTYSNPKDSQKLAAVLRNLLQ